MKLTPDDPKLTAYALGELDDAERAEVEKLIADSQECRAAVEEIRRTANLLTHELRNEPWPGLTPENRRVIEEEAKRVEPVIVPFSWKRYTAIAGLAAAAACVALMVVPGMQRPKESARRHEMVVAKAENAQQPEYQEGFSVTVATGPKDGTVLDPVIRPPTPTPTPEPAAYALAAAEKPHGGDSAQGPRLMIEDASSKIDINASTAIGVTGNQPPPNREYNAMKEGKTDGFAHKKSFIGNAKPQDQFRRVAVTKSSDDKRTRHPEELEDLVGKLIEDEVDLPPDASNYQPGTESYEHRRDNPFFAVSSQPVSTFSTDVDTASYSNIRRFLNEGSLPPRDAVRIEEMINYFPYSYEPPRGGDPFAVHIEVSDCPWSPTHRLARVGIKGKEIAPSKRPRTNLVLLVDVSGSMAPDNRLALLRKAFKQLVRELNDDDRVAIVTYAGTSGIRLASTSCEKRERILNAIDSLEAGGSTNGASGIQLAYQTATENFIEKGVNRVILATDGDFNVGVTDQDELVQLIQKKAKSGVFLSVLGVGMGNLKDSTMEKLADKGNGHYAYLDTMDEARKVLIEQLNGTLVTIAKDVKIQVEFNPKVAAAYRLIGYEKRVMRRQDFNNDKKDAGDIGAGHTVTALYEIIPAGVAVERPAEDGLKYQPKAEKPAKSGEWFGGWFASSEELMTVKLRFKKPDGDTSKLVEIPVTDKGRKLDDASADFKFAAAVASFGMLLRDAPHSGKFTYGRVLELAGDGEGRDPNGYRAEFMDLVKKARSLARE